MSITTILIILVIGVAGFVVLTYNSLIAKRNQVKSIEAGVDTQLKRRYDLLPNLVATAKAYMTHEAELLQTASGLPGDPRGKRNTENSQSVKRRRSQHHPSSEDDR